MDQWLSYRDPYVLKMEQDARRTASLGVGVSRPMFEVKGDISGVSVYQFSEGFYQSSWCELNDLIDKSSHFADGIAIDSVDRADIVVE